MNKRRTRLLLAVAAAGDTRLLRNLLQAKDGACEIHTVASLDAAMARLADHFDILLLASNLPGNRGLEGLRALAGRYPDLPIIMLTGLQDAPAGVDAVRGGAQDFLVKEEITPALLDRAIGYAIERKRMEGQARYAQKMETIATLAGGIAHDFNNILTSIVGYGSVLELKLQDRPEEVKTIHKLLKAADRASQLTSALLAFSRSRNTCMQRLDLRSFLARVSRLLPSLLGNEIRFETRLTDRLLEVHADPSQIEQVLVKLAVNARQALSGPGAVTLHLDPWEIPPDFREAYGFGRPGPYARILLTDDGPGMDPSVAERIFEPFFTTGIPGEGNGMGLAIVYGIIKQHLGYILCVTRPGAGSRFEIYLPLADSPRGQEAVGG